MDINTISLWSGFLGALLGATIPVVIMKMQITAQAKRDRINLSTNLAIEDYKMQIEISNQNKMFKKLPPISSYQYFHIQILNALEKDILSNDLVKHMRYKCFEIFVNDPEGFFSMGNDYYLKSDYDTAINCYEKAISIKSNYADAFRNMGLTYQKKGEIDKYSQYLLKASKLGDSIAQKHCIDNNII